MSIINQIFRKINVVLVLDQLVSTSDSIKQQPIINNAQYQY